jgi:regulatory protein RepA
MIPLRKAGPQNKAGDIGFLVNEFEKLAAVISCAHYSEGNQAGKESIDRISGSGIFAWDPDTIMKLTAHKNRMRFRLK